MAAFWVLLLVALALAFSLAPVCPGEVGVPELSVGLKGAHTRTIQAVWGLGFRGFRDLGFREMRKSV